MDNSSIVAEDNTCCRCGKSWRWNEAEHLICGGSQQHGLREGEAESAEGTANQIAFHHIPINDRRGNDVGCQGQGQWIGKTHIAATICHPYPHRRRRAASVSNGRKNGPQIKGVGGVRRGDHPIDEHLNTVNQDIIANGGAQGQGGALLHLKPWCGGVDVNASRVDRAGGGDAVEIRGNHIHHLKGTGWATGEHIGKTRGKGNVDWIGGKNNTRCVGTGIGRISGIEKIKNRITKNSTRPANDHALAGSCQGYGSATNRGNVGSTEKNGCR